MPRVNIKGRINRQNFELNWKIPGESSFSPCWYADLLGLHSVYEWYNEKRRPLYLDMDIRFSNLRPAIGARNQVGIGLSYRPASLCSLATQFQTQFLESIPCPIAGLKFPTLEFWTQANTANTQFFTFETNIPRKGIVRPQSQFPHSCVCERFIYSHDRSAYSAAGKYVD